MGAEYPVRGDAKRQRHGPLFSLTRHRASGAPINDEARIVSMGAAARDPLVHVATPSLEQLFPELRNAPSAIQGSAPVRLIVLRQRALFSNQPICLAERRIERFQHSDPVTEDG